MVVFALRGVLSWVLAYFLIVLLCVFTFRVPCCGVPYNFRSVRLHLQLFVGALMYLRYFICAFFANSAVQYTSMFCLSTSCVDIFLYCPFFVVPSVFSNVYSSSSMFFLENCPVFCLLIHIFRSCCFICMECCTTVIWIICILKTWHLMTLSHFNEAWKSRLQINKSGILEIFQSIWNFVI